jgi:L-2-hydroxycarboxylate dehydrogenase (NAD+)
MVREIETIGNPFLRQRSDSALKTPRVEYRKDRPCYILGHMLVKIDWLKDKIRDTLTDFPVEQVDVITDALLWADTTGKETQGIIKLAGTEPLQSVKPKGAITVDVKKCAALVHGNGNPSPVSTKIGMEKAIQLAHEHGVGIAGVNGIYSSNTTQSYYLYQIAQHGLVGFMCSRSPAAQTGFGSIDPLFGTNPLGIAIPTTGEPLFFDFTTSAITWYRLVLAQIRGEALPDYIAIDADGNFTPDPNEAMKGALMPYARDHRSSSMAMMVELLAGPLVGAAYVDLDLEHDWGSFILVIDPEILCGAEQLKKAASDVVAKIKGSRPSFGEKVRLPSELSLKRRKEALQTGQVDIDEKLLKHLGYL